MLYSSFNGIVLADKEGKEIARTLGNKKAALLQNHGLLTVGETIEAAVFWFMSLEKCCHAQLLADAAAGGRGHETVKINDEDAAFTCECSRFERFCFKTDLDVTILLELGYCSRLIQRTSEFHSKN